MNHDTNRFGKPFIAVGAPGSIARERARLESELREIESRLESIRALEALRLEGRVKLGADCKHFDGHGNQCPIGYPESSDPTCWADVPCHNGLWEPLTNENEKE